MWWLRLLTSAFLLAPAPAVPRARVLFFVATDCPYSDRYFPEMLRLEKEFDSQGVRFTWVYPNEGERLPAVQAHQEAFGAPRSAIDLDAGGKLTRQASVHITPEAAVLAPGAAGAWTVVYHGRIDDRYVHIGLERAHVAHHDLENALESILAGKQVAPPTASAVGCAIVARRP